MYVFLLTTFNNSTDLFGLLNTKTDKHITKGSYLGILQYFILFAENTTGIYLQNISYLNVAKVHLTWATLAF